MRVEMFSVADLQRIFGVFRSSGFSRIDADDGLFCLVSCQFFS